MSEQELQQRIRLELGRGPVRLWRNNVGALRDQRGQLVSYGLCRGSSDLIGLRRRGFARQEIDQLRQAYDLLFRDAGTLAERLLEVEAALGDSPTVRNMIEFVGSESSRGVLTPKV